jgi:arylformamidase
VIQFDKPINLLVGNDELSEIQKQTLDFFQYRENKGQKGVLLQLDGLNHFTILDELIRKDSQILKLVKEAAKR